MLKFSHLVEHDLRGPSINSSRKLIHSEICEKAGVVELNMGNAETWSSCIQHNIVELNKI